MMLREILNAATVLWNDRQGQDMVEYALIAGLVSTVAMALFPAIVSTNVLFRGAITALQAALATTAGQ